MFSTASKDAAGWLPGYERMYFPVLCVPDDWGKKYKSAEDAPETFDFWGFKLGRGFIADAQTHDVFGTIS